VESLGKCDTCGEFEGLCKCGKGKILIDGRRREKVSRFLSGLLRHFNSKFGVKVDSEGWANLKDVEKVILRKFGIGEEVIRLIAKFDPKAGYYW
jgi:putative RNA 2'-phosphotransferase